MKGRHKGQVALTNVILDKTINYEKLIDLLALGLGYKTVETQNRADIIGDFTLSFEQAKELMQKGTKCTHRFFGSGEYATMVHSFFIFEDGFTWSENEFFKIRVNNQSDAQNWLMDGWKVFQEQTI